MNPSNVRPAALAGRWYAADPAVLRRNVLDHLAAAAPEDAPRGAPVLAIVPHAGHDWSGAVAGGVLGLLRDRAYERILLLAPNHRHPLTGLSAPTVSAYATPLGDVPLDVEGREALIRAGVVRPRPEAHADEHAEEIQLPFLQVLWDSPPPLLPLLVPPLSESQRTEAAAALAPWADGRSLVIVSTDFTHYGEPFGFAPFRDDVPSRIAELDGGALERIQAKDPAGLLAYGRRTGITMCGLAATALALELPWPSDLRIARTGYARSADRDGDFSVSVSYAGLIGTQEETACDG